MKKKMVSVLLAAAMGTTALVGFGTTAYADDDVLEFYQDITRMRASGLQLRL